MISSGAWTHPGLLQLTRPTKGMTVGWQCTLIMLMSSMTRSREWLLLNAVEAWLHHYRTPNTPTVEQYKQLQAELHDAYMLTLNNDAEDTPPPRKQPRKRTNNGSQSQAKTI